jgi:peptidoglycan hydrolase-like protein with peptidoglycan-binding domain
MFAATRLFGGLLATTFGSVTRRRISIALAPVLAVLGLMVAPGTHALAEQTFTCHYSTGSLPPNTTVRLSNGTAHVTVGEFAGFYSGLTVQPSSTGITQSGKEAQCLLSRAGFSPGPIDGIFGPMSQTAARHFQAHVDSACNGGLGQDGLVGPQTWPWLRFYTAPPIGCGGL